MRAALLVVLAACTGSGVVVEPVIDLPSNDSAAAFPLDDLVLAVAHTGSTADLVSRTFASGQVVEMPGVPFGDDLVIHLTGEINAPVCPPGQHCAQEVSYGRTCQLAVNQNGATASPHLFFSRSVRFADVVLPAPPELRVHGLAIVDPDGAGLAIGGVDPLDPNSAVADVERFDPRTGELRPLYTVEKRIDAVAASLGTGADVRIALIGGLDSVTGVGAAFVELLVPDAPVARRYDRVDDASMGRVGMTATALTDGRVIVIGGRPPAGPPSEAVDELAITNGSVAIRLLHGILVHPRYGHTATRLGDDVGANVLVAGGLDAAGMPVAAGELFKSPLNEFSKTFTANMIVPRSRHQAVRLPDGSVLIIGGVDAAGVGVTKLELFTLDAGFVAAGDLPPTAGLLDFSVTPLPDGRVLLTGGTLDDGVPLDSAFIVQLDPMNGSVNVLGTDHMSVGRAGHVTTLLCDGTVLVTGGTNATSVAERYNPPPLGRR